MRKNIFVTVCVFVLVLGALTLVAAEREKPAGKIAVEGPDNSPERSGPAVRMLDTPIQVPASKNRVVGVIQYDDGTGAAVPGNSSFCYGNQFNTALGGPVNTAGTISKLQFFVLTGAGTDNVFISVFGSVVGTAASVISSISVPAASGTLNTYTFASPLAYPGASFLAGVWYVAGDSVALGTGTTAGQGYHGMLINDIAGTGFTTLPNINAFVRASGDVLVPVELMTFSVE